MSKVKADYELQTARRNKRNAAFDAHRDLDKIKTQRDNLSELAKSLRFALSELAKYFTHCEHDLNVSATTEEQLNASECDVNLSILSSATKRFINFKPDISSLIAAVEDPKLLEYLTNESIDSNTQINIVDCLECLNVEANKIVELSDKVCRRPAVDEPSDKTDCCEDEDGLMRVPGSSLDELDAIAISPKKKNLNSGAASVDMQELEKLLSAKDKEQQTLQSSLDKAEEKIRALEKELNESKSPIASYKQVKEDLTEGWVERFEIKMNFRS